MGYPFLVESNTIEKTALPYKTTLSKTTAKANHGATEWLINTWEKLRMYTQNYNAGFYRENDIQTFLKGNVF